MRAEVLRNRCVLRGHHKRGQNQTWLPHPCLLGGPHRADVLSKPCVPGVPIKGDKIKRGYLTPAFLWAQMGVEVLRNPCVVGYPHQRGHCMRILRVSSVPTGLIVADFFVPASVPSAELCLEDTVANTKGKRKKGRLATSHLHFRRSPTPGAGSRIKKG